MEFITTGNRIAVENFSIGKIYTIVWATGNYKSLACVGKGSDFVMFQDQAPDLLFCLTMETAVTVESIEEGGDSGTNNYNELENKPSINGIVLVGNKTGADLGLASQSDLEDYATNASVVAGLATKQDALSSSQLAAVNSGITSSLVTQIGTNTSAIAGKQDALSSSQLAAVNSGITSADVTQITTNKNNILKQQNAIADGGNGYAIINGKRLYMTDTEPTAPRIGDKWLSDTLQTYVQENGSIGTIEQGSFDSRYGTESVNTTRIRTTFAADINPKGKYTINATGVSDVVIYAYNSNSISDWNSSASVTQWQSLPYTFDTSSDLYLRFAFRKNSTNPDISPSDISNIVFTRQRWD